jgi:3-oxoacyl-[acyl-carrier-protein] synthase II
MTNCVAITGIGLVNPLGIGKEDFWKNLVAGESAISTISRFNADNLPVQIAGEIKNFSVQDFVPRRLAVKMDRFSHYAVAASTLALKDAGIEVTNFDPYRIGVWFGNNAGGWDICERGLFELYRDGATFVNPWQATAWFPTSPQGYVSIANGIKGMSKSFICDRASSSSALYFAVRAIFSGECDIILAGGTEAPVTPFGMVCYFETGELAGSITDTKAYKPFDKKRYGSVLGEGSTVLILESIEHAEKRGAKIYGKIYLGAMTTDAGRFNYKNYMLAQTRALANAGITTQEVDVIFPEAAGTINSDRLEGMAITETFSDNQNVSVACPKASFGHLYGASTATDIAVGLLASQEKMLPPTLNVEFLDDDFCLNISKKVIPKEIHNMLFNSRAREGSNVSMVVSTKEN